VVAYLLQWLPWMRSPRISFIYHFFVDISIICLCNAIVLQRLWEWGTANADSRLWSRLAVGGYVVAVALVFAFFYPILAGVPIPWDHWNARMWLPHWVI
ncbi:MAG: phospholipid carrier-dependent glycosyltransferase, partial [Candidatus Eremiobacteraeota bacterium]|nr:phospholipid carrier-dependent glycosyltransferase [Candidatus Eremiobacteraeota bacterium]